MPITVSTPHRSYAQERFIFVDHDGHDIRVIRERDFGSVWNGLRYRLTGEMSTWYTLHSPPPFSRADLFHLYNGASLARRPWVTTVENWQFNRLGPIDRAGLLAGRPCRRIMAISNWVIDRFRERAVDFGYDDRIMAKVELVPPPQALVPRQERDDDGRTRLCFVGSAFFRKGGLELLRALERLAPEELPLELEIVSSLATDAYPPGTEFGPEDVAEVHRLLERLGRSVRRHASLPNAQVLELLGRSDVGVLPSFFDTYGFSVLEMMGAGLPMVVTNQRSLPELVTEERGWVLELPLDAHATVDRTSAEKRRAVSELLVEQLTEVLRRIASAPEEIRRRGAHAREYVHAVHDPARYAERLRRVYTEALS